MSDFDSSIDGKDLEASHKTQRGVLYAIVVFFSLAFVMFGIPTEDYSEQVSNEVNSLKTITGPEEFAKVTERAGRWYDAIMVESGGQEMLKRLFAGTAEHQRVEFGSRKWTSRLANNIPYIAYQGAFRSSAFMHWSWILLPFIAAAIIDAVNLWRAKVYGFGQMRIRKFHLWRRMFGYLLIGLLAFFLVPALAGTYTVYIPPSIILITTFLITRWVKEYQVQL